MGHRLIFLDIDGVCNNDAVIRRAADKYSHAAYTGWGDTTTTWDVPEDVYLRAMLDDGMIGRVQELAEQADAQIVISSTWRLLDYQGLLSWLPEKGLKAPIIGRTASISSHHFNLDSYAHGRGLEIEMWCHKHIPADQLHALRLVILDDDADMGRLRPWLLQTSPQHGFTRKHIDRGLRVLDKNPHAGSLLVTPHSHFTLSVALEHLKTLPPKHQSVGP